METTLLSIISVIILLLVLSLILRVLGFALKTITNPKILLIALVICIAVLMTNKMMS